MRVLAVGAHPDDIELGCGGALAVHVASGDEVTMLVLSFGESGRGGGDVRRAEQERAADCIGADLRWGGFSDGELGSNPRLLLQRIEQILETCSPDLVYTHAREDSHQDHRDVSLATIGAARHCPRLLTFDGPSAIAFTPTVFVDIQDTLDKKLLALRQHDSQLERSSLVSVGGVEAQALFRGTLARSEVAEGFAPVRYLIPAP